MRELVFGQRPAGGCATVASQPARWSCVFRWVLGVLGVLEGDEDVGVGQVAVRIGGQVTDLLVRSAKTFGGVDRPARGQQVGGELASRGGRGQDRDLGVRERCREVGLAPERDVVYHVDPAHPRGEQRVDQVASD